MSSYKTLFLLLCLPSMLHAMSFEEARHLLQRSGFGGTAVQIELLVGVTHESAVEQLVAAADTAILLTPPEWVDTPPPDRRYLRALNSAEKKALRKQWRQRGIALQAWWMRQMLTSESPLAERMVLFWHNHFTSSMKKVKWIPLIFRQHETVRRHALGNFRDLLQAMARDPAMLRYLDGAVNRRKNPNENFARELLELFTLGEGYYTEVDIKAAARAFTGWSIDRRSGKFRYFSRWHDDGEKLFLGRRGRFDGDDILRILLDHPRTAITITDKLWREFISPVPDPYEIKRLAKLFRESDYQLRPLLKALFNTDQFRAVENRGSLIKSPVELLIGTLHQLEISVESGRLLALASRRLGQDLFNPPNVKGWPGGEYWINADTLLQRRWMMQRLTAEDSPKRNKITSSMAYATLSEWERLLLPFPSFSAPLQSDNPYQGLSALLTEPGYQLK
ncbi:MAG: DUF1800 domain-containing protein [gamma proteobacterium endosymbiont of Lamellibrachia anaximandri]|nr:DUF1800 domain-containing protein [gamma proteobacterium endosymbiont of Lamellibrachia anaximandri]MBL3533555.1 DUF1800 domain-containing protein [gamma proteobacterium endosymbiont of Lamellibrachia anaximandri]